MSLRLFIYYCALCGGWAAFFGWAAGLVLAPSSPLGNVGIRGMWLGMFIAFGLGLVDALWNVPLVQVHLIGMRVGVGVLVGCVGGLLGGVIGQFLFQATTWKLFYVFGWTLTGLLVEDSPARVVLKVQGGKQEVVAILPPLGAGPAAAPKK